MWSQLSNFLDFIWNGAHDEDIASGKYLIVSISLKGKISSRNVKVFLASRIIDSQVRLKWVGFGQAFFLSREYHSRDSTVNADGGSKSTLTNRDG